MGKTIAKNKSLIQKLKKLGESDTRYYGKFEIAEYIQS